MNMKKLLCGLVLMGTTLASAKDIVVFVCAHPDDLAGCSGTALLLAEKFDVRVIDFTRGENGLGEAGYRDGSTARLRMEEERKACAFLGTTPVFLDEVNYKGREAFAGRESTETLRRLFTEWKPRAVILHWPIDIHPDHIQSYAAAMHALTIAGLSPEIYFQEQTTQSRSFKSAFTVDITRVKAKKDQLILSYACQEAEAIRKRKEEDSIFRGRRIGVEHAECFGVWEGSVPADRSVLREIGAR